MSRVWHMLIFFCYVTLASAIGVLAHRVIPGVEPVASILIALVFFLACALLQESYLRREDAVKSMRRLLLLKRALDRNREELVLARDEIRRLFEAVEHDGGDRMTAAINALAASGTETARRSRHEAEEDARSLLERMALSDDESAAARAPRQRPPRDKRPPPPDRAAASDRSMREASAEVRVLHNLVEQLYSGREKPPMSLSEDSVSLAPEPAKREPTLGRSQGGRAMSFDDEMEEEDAVAGGGLGRALRGGLRVVAGAAGGRGGAVAARAPAVGREDEALLTTIREALRADKVDLYLQPIVSLPQRKRRYYECFSRIRAADGEIIGPDRYIDVARSAGLLTAIDNMLLFRCVQLLRKLRRKDFSAAFFCNIAPHTLSDREFFRDFIEYMESHSELAPNLVLEFSQADIGGDLTTLAPDFERLGGLGYRFSLDGVRNLDLDLDLLEEKHFAYIKIEAKTVLQRLQKGGAEAAELRGLKQELDGRGIDLIVDRIETEATLVELLDFNIDFGQGYLFGEPRLSKEPPGA
ncbi:EAL domain-containing protein [Pacificispira sp.]|uniref:EAL domain-containing protein n=2 Tax=Pacificispira sp. TaxID=2888761 RepID=UPI003B51E284